MLSLSFFTHLTIQSRGSADGVALWSRCNIRYYKIIYTRRDALLCYCIEHDYNRSTLGCNYLSLPFIPISGTTSLIGKTTDNNRFSTILRSKHMCAGLKTGVIIFVIPALKLIVLSTVIQLKSIIQLYECQIPSKHYRYAPTSDSW